MGETSDNKTFHIRLLFKRNRIGKRGLLLSIPRAELLHPLKYVKGVKSLRVLLLEVFLLDGFNRSLTVYAHVCSPKHLTYIKELS